MHLGLRFARVLLPAVSLLWLAGSGVGVLAQEDDDCQMCHGDRDSFEDWDRAEQLTVDADRYAGSMHAEAGLSCVDCHQDLAGVDDYPHAERLGPPSCSPCHEDVQEIYDESVHGYAALRGNTRAPGCSSCHGGHDIASSADPAASTHRSNLPGTCAKCHGKAGLLTNELVKLPQTFASYAKSVHGNGNGDGHDHNAEVAASCTDCHGVHDLRGMGDPDSRIHRANVATTCGHCHGDVQEEYAASIHGLALDAGISDSPTCNDCHGEHLILSADDPDSKTYSRSLATDTCGTCHDDPVIVAKYRMQEGVVGSYVDSYHGWATRRNSHDSASCVSCHTAHSVLPESHSASTVHPDNVVATCGKCHEHADLKFAASYTHEAASITANPVNRWIRSVYLVMIAAVIGGMLLHNLVIVNYYMVEKRRRQAKLQSVRRLDLSQILQHLVLTGSFLGLVLTGFALRFPESWWVRYLSELGLSEPVRSYAHRVFGVVLVGVGIWHMIYVAATRRGREELRAIAPARTDLAQFVNHMRFHLWSRRGHVEFGRYDYTQKAEYWALVWGTIVMIASGLVLWFPEQAVRLFPAWAIPASQTIHYYEAWLATLAIIVWHLFFVMFHPEAYPMSWIWVTGKMSLEEAREHHAQWYKEELATSEGSPPPSRGRQRRGANKPAA